jgi:hypothetical protein
LRTRDRVGAVVIGLIGGFWVGLPGRLILGPIPASFPVLAFWAVGGIVVGAVFGDVVPRVVTVVLYPFAFFGIGGRESECRAHESNT